MSGIVLPSELVRSPCAAVALLLAAVPSLAQGIKVNDPLAVGIVGDVTRAQISPDSSRVVYLADEDQDEVFRVYSVPASGEAVALGVAPVVGGDVRAFAISANSRHVVYFGDQDTDEVLELYSVRIEGSGPAVKLNAALAPGADVAGFELSPRGELVVFAVKEAGGTTALFSVPIQGGEPAPLGPPLAPGIELKRLAVSPNGRYVVVHAGPSSGAASDLFLVPILGGRVVQLDPGLENPRAFAVSPNSKHVVFAGAQLYSVVTTGGAAVPLAGFSESFQIVADSRRVLFLARGDLGRDQLHVVDIGGGPAMKLAEHGVQRVNRFAVSPDLAHVAYTLEFGDSVVAVRTVPLAGGPSTLIRNGNELVLYPISPDSSRLLYAELSPDGGDGPMLYSVPLPGGISTRLTERGVVALGITPDSQTVICYDYAFSDESQGLYRVPIDGGTEVRLNDPPVTGGAVVTEPAPLLAAGATRVVYRADQDRDQVFELYTVSTEAGPTKKLNGPLVAGGIAGDVQFSVASPDGRYVVYIADEDTDEVLELYSAAVPGGAPVKLNGALVRNGDVADFSIRISPDSRRVVYVADQELDGIRQLYSVPIDGGSAVRLDDVPGVAFGVWGAEISADSRRVVFTQDRTSAFRAELFSAPIDGGPVVDLSAAVPALESVQAYRISPDTARVVIAAFQGDDDVHLELFSLPIDGGALVQLNPPPVAGGGLAGVFEILPDSSGVVYGAALEVPHRHELWHTPITGGASTKLSPPLLPDQDVLLYPISPDSRYVVFRVERDSNVTEELYSVRLDGFVRTKLSPPLVAGGSVRDFAISADSSRVVYRADQDVNERFELYSVSIGGGPVTRLSAPLVTGGDVEDFQIARDSGRVAYRADQAANDVFELFSVGVAGGTPARLNAPLAAGGDVLAGFALRGSRALYLADQEQNDVVELFAVPLAGGSPPSKLNAPLVSGGDVLDSFFHFQPSGRFVFYRADQDLDEVVELYASALVLPGSDPGRPAASRFP